MLFCPTFRAKSSGPFQSILVKFSRFFPHFQSILVDFHSFQPILVSFIRFQSILVNFGQFQPGHTRQKRRIFLPTGGAKQRPRILCEFCLMEVRISVRIPERISVRISQVRCNLSWKVQMIMKNPSQNSQQNPQPNSHGRVGEIFTDFFCRVQSVELVNYSQRITTLGYVP